MREREIKTEHPEEEKESFMDRGDCQGAGFGVCIRSSVWDTHGLRCQLTLDVGQVSGRRCPESRGRSGWSALGLAAERWYLGFVGAPVGPPTWTGTHLPQLL